jgi:hypothetical protein
MDQLWVNLLLELRFHFFLKMKTIRTCKAYTVRVTSIVRVTSTRCVHPGKKNQHLDFVSVSIHTQEICIIFVGRSQYVAIAQKASALTDSKYILVKIISNFPS